MRGADPGTSLISAALLLGGSLISLFTAHAQEARAFNPGQDQPVISEFCSNGPAAGYEAQDDFVEIFNPSGRDVNLSGLSIESITSGGSHKLLARFPVGTLLSQGQNYLIAGPHYSSPDTPDDQSTMYGIPDDGGVALLNASDQVIDQAGMSAASAEGSPLPPLIGNLDHNPLAKRDKDPSLTKTLSLTHTFSPTKTSTRTKMPTSIPGCVAINEFLPLPATDWNEDGFANEKDEYVGLINLGSTPVKLKGWKLEDGANMTSFHLPDMSIDPGEILVFFRFETDLPLSDAGGTVRLVKSGGQTADEFHYSQARARNRTWCRLPGKGSELLFACIPTPGQPNMAYAAGMTDPADRRICGLPDTAPAEIVLAECEGVGDGVWNEAMKVQFWLARQGKWDVFVE